MREIITSLVSGLIGSFLGGLIAIYGGIVAVRRAEYYRLRTIVKNNIENTISKVRQHNHPYLLIEDPALNSSVNDIIMVMPFCKRRAFLSQCSECRYDKNDNNLIPEEYTKSTTDGRKLIIERFHTLISKL